jgi:hypothetical protein
VSAHFARFRVTEISLRSQALGQFDDRADPGGRANCWPTPGWT